MLVVAACTCAAAAGDARADGGAPPVVGNVAGTLLGSGPLTGIVSVIFDASDVSGSGLRSDWIDVDGSTRVSGAPGSGSAWLALDTGTLSDGPHQVVVGVEDGAGDVATVWSGEIVTANAPRGGVAAIFGTAAQGSTLLADAGSWSPAASAIGYQWERCDAAGSACAAIVGASVSSYTVAAADDYGRVRVVATASDAGWVDDGDLGGVGGGARRVRLRERAVGAGARGRERAGGQRQRARGDGAQRGAGGLVGRAAGLRLPLGALRWRRWELHGDRGGERGELRAWGRRCGGAGAGRGRRERPRGRQ